MTEADNDRSSRASPVKDNGAKDVASLDRELTDAELEHVAGGVKQSPQPPDDHNKKSP